MSDRFLKIVDELKVSLSPSHKTCLECRKPGGGTTARYIITDQYIDSRFPSFAHSIIRALRDEYASKLILHQYCASIRSMPAASETTKQLMTSAIAWTSINRKPEILKMKNYKHYLSENSKKLVEEEKLQPVVVSLLSDCSSMHKSLVDQILTG
jgi:hypothetical protein